MDKNITIIGTGNVAHHLAKRLCSLPNVQNIYLYGRNPQKSKKLADESGCIELKSIHDIPDGLVYICVNDDAIENVIQQRNWDKHVLVHTAGSIDINIFKPYAKHYGVIYLFQSFSKFRSLNWMSIPACIEFCDETSKEIIENTAHLITKNVYYMDTNQRRVLHVCAIFCSNFVNHMITLGKDLADKNGINYNILTPLIKETVEKAIETDPHAAQTGPARRNDLQVIEFHKSLLTDEENKRNIYELISNSIIKRYHC